MYNIIHLHLSPLLQVLTELFTVFELRNQEIGKLYVV